MSLIGPTGGARLRALMLVLSVGVAGCGGGGGGSGSAPSAAAAPLPPANNSPSISGSPPPTVEEESEYSFVPSANDPDNDPLTFSIENRPTWAVFDSATGALMGTPVFEDIGVYPDITISVTDGSAEDALTPFVVEVLELPNDPPTIDGSPSTAVVPNETYSFTPDADDADGDTLIFSVDGLPPWASFDESTGEISGTPDGGDVGIYPGIVITVSDGRVSVSLPEFSIDVRAIMAGNVTLSWTAPTTNTDGSALTDLSGFKLYWGTSPGSYPNVETIDNPGITTFVVENLMPGTYYFVCTAFNADSVESAFSNETVKSVPQ